MPQSRGIPRPDPNGPSLHLRKAQEQSDAAILASMENNRQKDRQRGRPPASDTPTRAQEPRRRPEEPKPGHYPTFPTPGQDPRKEEKKEPKTVDDLAAEYRALTIQIGDAADDDPDESVQELLAKRDLIVNEMESLP